MTRVRVRPEEVRDPTYLLFYLLEFSLCVPTALFGLSPSFSYTLSYTLSNSGVSILPKNFFYWFIKFCAICPKTFSQICILQPSPTMKIRLILFPPKRNQFVFMQIRNIVPDLVRSLESSFLFLLFLFFSFFLLFPFVFFSLSPSLFLMVEQMNK